MVKHDSTPEFLVEQVAFIQEEDDHDLHRVRACIVFERKSEDQQRSSPQKGKAGEESTHITQKLAPHDRRPKRERILKSIHRLVFFQLFVEARDGDEEDD